MLAVFVKLDIVGATVSLVKTSVLTAVSLPDRSYIYAVTVHVPSAAITNVPLFAISVSPILTV